MVCLVEDPYVNLKENGSTATSVIFAELNRKGSEWQFKAIGEGKIADLNGILGIYMKERERI